MKDVLSVRELGLADIEPFTAYWLNSSKAYLSNMGVDINKLPSKDDFFSYWSSQLETPIEQRLSYCVIWLKNNIAIGHSNTRPTIFGKEAFMHLHLWNPEDRGKGLGSKFVKLTLPHFFENLKLKDLYCEPYALNSAPNKTMEKLGFEFKKDHQDIPGPSNFEQILRQWCLSYERYTQLYKTGT